MSNHIHMIVGTNKDSLSDIIRTSRNLNPKRVSKALIQSKGKQKKMVALALMGRAGR